jgi:hypothetical protein
MMDKIFAVTLSKKQCEILEDVLSEIEESRVYEGEDKTVLNELKEIFDYFKLKEYFKN